jgi:hypothetical protein
LTAADTEIQGHHPDTGRALRWEEAKPDVLRLSRDPEELRDAWPGDVGVQDAYAVARPGQGGSEEGGHGRLSHAALAAHHRDHVADGAVLRLGKLLDSGGMAAGPVPAVGFDRGS